MDFTTSSTKILVIVETLPEREEGLWAWFGTGIKQNAHFWIQNAAKSCEQPSMRVDLLCVALLQAEHHLHWWKSACAVVERADELLVWRNRELCGVLELCTLLA